MICLLVGIKTSLETVSSDNRVLTICCTLNSTFCLELISAKQESDIPSKELSHVFGRPVMKIMVILTYCTTWSRTVPVQCVSTVISQWEGQSGACLCWVCMFSPIACVGSVLVVWFSPTVRNNTDQNASVEQEERNNFLVVNPTG